MKINQIGLVVKDLKDSINKYIEVDEIGPWKIREITTNNGLKLKRAAIMIGQMELELVEPVSSGNIYDGFLKDWGEGLHHIRIEAKDKAEIEKYLAFFQKKKIAMIQHYTDGNVTNYCLDTWKELGLYLEIQDGDYSNKGDVYPEDYVSTKQRHQMNIKQFAVVVKSAKQYIDKYCELLGVKTFDVRHFRPTNMKSLFVEGEQQKEGFEFICAVAWLDNIEIEVIEPVKGKNIYWEFLDKKGEGFHHIKDIFPDEEIAKEVNWLKKFDVRIMQTGWIDGDSHYYMSTDKKLNMIIEFGNGGKIGEPDYRYPENN